MLNEKSRLYRLKKHDISGQKFNLLTAIERVDNSGIGKSKWKCVCECGNTTEVGIANLRNGNTKSCGCLKKKNGNRKQGEESSGWKGGKITTPEGYVKIMKKGHPNANADGYVAEHILVMSEYLGRPIDTDFESVHHKNGLKNCNDLSNLELLTKHQHFIGQRVSDLVEYAAKYLLKYAPEVLSDLAIKEIEGNNA